MCRTRRIHWTARSAGVYICSILNAPPVMRVVSAMQTSIQTHVIIELGVAVILILSPFLLAFAPTEGKVTRVATSVMLVISAAVLMLVSLMSDALFGTSLCRFGKFPTL